MLSMVARNQEAEATGHLQLYCKLTASLGFKSLSPTHSVGRGLKPVRLDSKLGYSTVYSLLRP